MAENTIAQAYVQILPTTEGIQGQLSEQLGGPAEESGKKAGGDWAAGFGGALKTGGQIALAVGTAAVDAGKAMLDSIAQTAEYGDNIDKMSQKLGMSAQAYQEWDAILQHSGASIDSMQNAMKTLQVSAETNKDAFQKLGLSQQEVAAMTPEELFGATITALQNVESETERTYLATQLLGRGGTELGALLNTSAEDTEAMRQRVHELGGVMSDEAVKAAAAYQDSLQDMQTAFSGLSRGLLQEFMPGITTVMDGLTEVFSGNSEGGIAMISEGIDDLVTRISEKLPEFLDLGLQILEALINAIIENLPTLLGASGEIIGQLIAGLIRALPMLIAQAPEIIAAIVQGLINAWPEIRDAGGELLEQFGNAILDGLGALWDAGSDMVSAVWDGIKAIASDAWNWGKDLVSNFAQGILNNFPLLRSAADGLAGIVNRRVHFSQPDEGPLKDFDEYAPDMVDLFASGLRERTPALQRQVEETFDFRAALQPAALLPQGLSAPGLSGRQSAQGMPRQLVVPFYIDRQEAGRLVVDLFNVGSAAQGQILVGGAPA